MTSVAIGRGLGALIVASMLSAVSAQVLSRESLGTGCVEPNGQSDGAALSADGRWLVFSSRASNLVPNDTNGDYDVFLRDRWTRTTTCVSVAPNGVPGNALSVDWSDVTPDGRWVAFQSKASNLVPNDTNASHDVFVRDVLLGNTARVSVLTGGAQANGYSGEASISDDGRFVAFDSMATNVVPGDPGNQPDVFVHDRDPDGNGVYDEGNGTTQCLSVDAATGTPVDLPSIGPQISGDGRYVAFPSWGNGIVPGDLNDLCDVFLWDRLTATTILLSVDSNGVPANHQSTAVSLSADGLHASFASKATNLVPGGDGNLVWDVYVRSWQAGTTELASGGTDTHGTYISQISGDGRYVVLETQAALVVADTNNSSDVYLRDRSLGATTLVSGPALGDCTEPAISADGGFVAWTASSGMLPGDSNGLADIYVLDRGGLQPAQVEFCFGDGTGAACPCGNFGLPGTGCAHSQGAAAWLDAYGTTSPDHIVLAVHGEIANVLTIFLQGTSIEAPAAFGDGLRCVGGSLKRLNVTSASSGNAYYPACPFGPSILDRSAELGDPIAPGSTRYYMTYYRDSELAFCPAPQGNSWNASQAIALTW